MAKKSKNRYNIDMMDAAKLREVIYDERRFYGMIVHEIRTQVGIVSNLSEMLLDEKLAKSHEFYKKSLKQTSERIVHLSQNFLEIDEYRKKEGQLKVEAVELASFMEIFVMPYTHMAANKGLLLKLMVEEKCPKYIRTDVVRLGQIMSNLIENAIKYTDTGKVQIHVHYNVDAALPLMFDVIDTGIGLGLDDEKTRNKIFTEYARLDNALDKTGIGLGLWIIKSLAQNMGGEVKVEINHPLNKDGGACFRLSLPLNVNKDFIRPIEMQKTVPIVEDKSLPNADIIQVEGRVLLVEDNRLNQHIIGTMLSSAGFEFDIAASLVEAKHLIDIREYVLILADLNLPDGRGEDLLVEFSDENIIALTADGGVGLEAKLKALGFKALIQKPIATKDFFNKIYGILAAKEPI